MSKRRGNSRKGKGSAPVEKTDNTLQVRMRKVGIEKFGLLLVDSGKRHFAVRLTNFFGDALWTPDPVRNTRSALEKMIAEVESLTRTLGLADLVVGIERTGRWHHPVKQMLESKWTVKMIHPFTTKQLRLPDSLGIKTDSTDLIAMQRAMICGYGRDEPTLSGQWLEFRSLSRMRGDLVDKRACLKTQCACRMEALLPGYTDLFEDLWRTPTAAVLIETYPSAEKLLRSDVGRIMAKLSKKGVRCQPTTIERVRAWAAHASPADPGAEVNLRILSDYLALIRKLTSLVDHYEAELLGCLVRTPAVLLLSITGVNAVSASEYASEMGPHENYPGPKHVTGRAGLFPSRSQSDETDHADGPVAGGRNKRLRDSILDIAHNLLSHNPYFKAWKQMDGRKHWTEKAARPPVGCVFTRVSFSMMRLGETFNHPIGGRQDSVLCKLLAFGRGKRVPADRLHDLAVQALAQLPDDCLAFERRALLCGGWEGTRNVPRPTEKPPKRSLKTPEYVVKLIADIDGRMLGSKEEEPVESTD